MRPWRSDDGVMGRLALYCLMLFYCMLSVCVRLRVLALCIKSLGLAYHYISHSTID